MKQRKSNNLLNSFNQEFQDLENQCKWSCFDSDSDDDCGCGCDNKQQNPCSQRNLPGTALIYTTQTNLRSDIPMLARYTDSNVVNPWGIVSDGADSLWVANTGTGTVIQISQTGELQAGPIFVQGTTGSTGTTGGTGGTGGTGATFSIEAQPTGLVWNGTTGFVIHQGFATASADLITVTENGTIAAYNPMVNFGSFVTVVDHSHGNTGASGGLAGDSKYSGVTILGDYLYVSNFGNGVIEKYDREFNWVSSFTDNTLLASGYSPFNVATNGCELYVSYALIDQETQEPVFGMGKGYINVFDADGNLIQRLVSGGSLNAPWGMVAVEGTHLLVGNFGDGKVYLYNLESGELITSLKDRNGNQVVLDGLWGLELVNGNLFFAAGIDDEEHGLIGVLNGVSIC